MKRFILYVHCMLCLLHDASHLIVIRLNYRTDFCMKNLYVILFSCPREALKILLLSFPFECRLWRSPRTFAVVFGFTYSVFMWSRYLGAVNRRRGADRRPMMDIFARNPQPPWSLGTHWRFWCAAAAWNSDRRLRQREPIAGMGGTVRGSRHKGGNSHSLYLVNQQLKPRDELLTSWVILRSCYPSYWIWDDVTPPPSSLATDCLLTSLFRMWSQCELVLGVQNESWALWLPVKREIDS